MLGILGVPLPGVEIGIAVSAVVLGMMVALAARPPLWVAAVMVGAFAIFHGHAHGAELPPGADALAYSAGFVIATGCLHLAGIAFGLLARWPAGRIAVRDGRRGDRDGGADVPRPAGVSACRALAAGRLALGYAAEPALAHPPPLGIPRFLRRLAASRCSCRRMLMARASGWAC